MKIDLKTYLDSRDKIRDEENSPGPFVTISRAFGCDATPIARKLIHVIAEDSYEQTNEGWSLINKELLDYAAKELKVNPLRITSLMDNRSNGLIENMFSSFSSINPYGVSDKKIIETLKDVITHFAYKGKAIIVGRGGANITYKIPNALHIRLHAPFEWRVNRIKEKRNMTKAEASQLVTEMDQKRAAWIEHLINKPVDYSIYDLSFNRQHIDDDSVIDTILALMKSKKMIAKSELHLV